MPRLLPLVALLPLLAALALAQPPMPKEPPAKKLTDEEKKELEAKWTAANEAGMKAFRSEKVAEAVVAFEDGLKVARQLYNKADYPDGHRGLISSLTNLGLVSQIVGRLAAAETHLTEALGLCRRLFDGDDANVANNLNILGHLYRAQGRLTAAEPLLGESLAMLRRLHGGRDHPAVAMNLNTLGLLHSTQGRMTTAELLGKEALDMFRRLHRDDHPNVAMCLNNLAQVQAGQGKIAAAELLFKDALAMYGRLFKGDHIATATCQHNLAGMSVRLADRQAETERGFKDALAMRKRLFKGDHPDVAHSLAGLAGLYLLQGRCAAAEPYLDDALAMRKRLFKGDHRSVAESLSQLGTASLYQGKYDAAEARHRDALDMLRRLFGDHPDVALEMKNLGGVLDECGKPAAAAPLHAASLAMFTRLTTAFARTNAEGDGLTFAAAQPVARDRFLASTRRAAAADARYDPAAAFPTVWATKGVVARATEQRHLRARAAASDPKAATLFAELTRIRRLRAELITAPPTADPETKVKREDDLKALDARVAAADKALRPLLPDLARLDKLEAATPDDLRKALPAGTVFVDCFRYVHFEQDPKKPGTDGEKHTPRYLAFVVTRDEVKWVDLDTANKIEPAVEAWREAITGGKPIPAEMPVKVRELVWEPVRKAIPAGVNTVYICPDAGLCRVPFAALPGDKGGTILLDDFAVATVPHAPFLLDQLWPADEPAKEPPADALVVGGVAFDAKPDGKPAKDRSDPLVKDGAKLSWGFLPGTEAEAGGFKTAAEKGKRAVVLLTGENATAAGVLAALPKARTAHIATHGYFADPTVRSALQTDPAEYRLTQFGERVGRVANSPLLMTGLVFAGANDPKAVGRGIVTGEALVDLDLSGLELAVLSACETGLGDVAGGEGVFGLQRAFHLAGTRNVVCSLWKVPDQATAALMGRFYHHLWVNKEPPVQALRKAQLDLYRHPDKTGQWAKDFRGATADDDKPDPKAIDDKTAHPRLWAAFTLSGLGR